MQAASLAAASRMATTTTRAASTSAAAALLRSSPAASVGPSSASASAASGGVLAAAAAGRALRPPGPSPPRRARPPLQVQAGRGFSELLSLRDDKKKSKSGARPRLKPHTVSPRLPVPAHIPLPPYVDTGTNPYDEGIQTHDAAGIAKMRAAGALAAEVLAYAGTLVAPGVTTDAIDKAVHARILEAGAYPSPLTYGNFPKSVCTSVNECICHGIPDARPLVAGDILNIDVTVYLDGHHGDTSRMFYVGGAAAASPDARRLCATTKEALDAAIALVRPGLPVSAIGDAIQAIADRERLGIVREFVGHGVGRVFHSNPAIVHCRNREPGVLVEGQTFTIEPMLTLGSPRSKMWKDGWTVVTADASLAAQYEHTLLVTAGGVEVLTAWPDVEGVDAGPRARDGGA